MAAGRPTRDAPAGQRDLQRQDLAADAPEGETAGAPPHGPGGTNTIRDEHPSHRLPHERDESTTTQQGGPSDIGRRAHDDAQAGIADTSRGETTDDTYAREFRSDPAETPPERRAPPGKRH
jgi:hypothetical protein